jgi:hypothetical protein
MSLVIDNPEVEIQIARRAAKTGMSAEEVVLAAVLEGLPRLPDRDQPNRLRGDELRQRIQEIQAAVAALPVLDPTFTQDSLYDENGFPA